MIFREIAHGSTEFEEEVDLRRGLLRAPRGLDLGSEELAEEYWMISAATAPSSASRRARPPGITWWFSI